MKFDAEFKKAISLLPQKEKDKLILRLLRRDSILAHKLYFELISADSIEDKRLEMEVRVRKEIKRMTDRFRNVVGLMDIRYLSGDITEHVKITTDKYGEASLNLLMLNELLAKNNDRIAQARPKDSYKLSIYIIARVFKILVLIKALHEDYLIEFDDALQELQELMSNNATLMKIAINNGFDINWLSSSSIPDDIADILKGVRASGFLKLNPK